MIELNPESHDIELHYVFAYDEETGLPVIEEDQVWIVEHLNFGEDRQPKALVSLRERTLVEKDYRYKSTDWASAYTFLSADGKYTPSGKYYGHFIQRNERTMTETVMKPGKARWFRPSVPYEEEVKIRVSDVYTDKKIGAQVIPEPFDALDIRKAAEAILIDARKRKEQDALYGEYPPKKLI